MEIEKSIRGSEESVEKEELHKKRKQHRQGGIRTLPFILGEHSLSMPSHHDYYASVKLTI